MQRKGKIMADLEKARKELNLSQDEVLVDETIIELSDGKGDDEDE